MPTSPTTQYRDFSKDVLGRYVCNGLDEALNRLRPREPFTDTEAELISQRIEAMKRYLERLAERVRRLEAGGE